MDWQGSNTGGSSQTGGNIEGSSQTGSNNGFQVEGPITYDLDVPDGTFIRNLLDFTFIKSFNLFFQLVQMLEISRVVYRVETVEVVKVLLN